MAMARDGLLPSFFSEVNQRTQVPVKGTITTGFCAAVLAFFMDVSQLAGMVYIMDSAKLTIFACNCCLTSSELGVGECWNTCCVYNGCNICVDTKICTS